MTNAVYETTKELYRSMPGATMPGFLEGRYAWGEVQDTNEWAFCETIAKKLVEAQQADPFGVKELRTILELKGVIDGTM